MGFDFGRIAEAVEFLRAFSEGDTFGSEAESVNELLAFVEFMLTEGK